MLVQNLIIILSNYNTFNKKEMREQLNNPFVKKTQLKLNYFIKETPIRNFYTELK